MARILMSWLISTLSILLASYIIPGIRVDNAGAAFMAAAVLGVLNVLVRPILVLLTLPITIITLGLFLFIINALLFLLAGSLISGFQVRSFSAALLGSLVVSVVSFVAHMALF